MSDAHKAITKFTVLQRGYRLSDSNRPDRYITATDAKDARTTETNYRDLADAYGRLANAIDEHNAPKVPTTPGSVVRGIRFTFVLGEGGWVSENGFYANRAEIEGDIRRGNLKIILDTGAGKE